MLVIDCLARHIGMLSRARSSAIPYKQRNDGACCLEILHICIEDRVRALSGPSQIPAGICCNQPCCLCFLCPMRVHTSYEGSIPNCNRVSVVPIVACLRMCIHLIIRFAFGVNYNR